MMKILFLDMIGQVLTLVATAPIAIKALLQVKLVRHAQLTKQLIIVNQLLHLKDRNYIYGITDKINQSICVQKGYRTIVCLKLPKKILQ